MKHSRSEIAYLVKELSKVLDMLDKAAFKETKRITKFALDTANHELSIAPEKMVDDEWILKVYTDSD